jgi:crotonobetainyl-CoA:carnitine CoA-transferase CaiB-like acyl-CoA transferase
VTAAEESPLAGLRVLELGGDLSTAYCARQFALWGADVVVVEPEGGSPMRRLRPMAKTRDRHSLSLAWEYVAAGKRSLALAEAATAAELCDVVIVSGAEGMAAFGLSLADLRARRPELVAVAVSPFGARGPYAAYKGDALTVQALSGYLALNGSRYMPPLPAPAHLVEFVIGVNAFVGALAALYGRERHGCGDLVEVNGIETLAAMTPFLRVQYMGRDKVREGGTEAGVRILPCADGWISMLISDPRQKRVLGEVLGVAPDDWPADLYEGGYHQIVAKAQSFLGRYTRRKSMDELFLALETRGVVCGRVNTPQDLLASQQLEARGYFMPMRHPELGELKFPGVAARPKQAVPAAPAPAPRSPGGTTLAQLGWRPQTGAIPNRTADSPPLEGLRVLDLTQAWIGPFATLILADLGAEVIKIESHRRPDVWRQASPNPVALAEVKAVRVNRSHYFNSVNRNKRSLCLDLASDEGKALFRRLAASADVVAENYTPRVMERFGLDYESLAKLRPGLVMASFSGFGKTGPLSDFKSNGSAIEALAGWDHLHRYPGGPPVLMGFYQADPICGLQMAAMILMALWRRARTGRGECFDGAMLDASVGYIGDVLLEAQVGADVPAPGGGPRDAAPCGVYPTMGEDRWIAISAEDEAAWQALTDLVGEALAPWALADLALRLAERDAIDQRLGDWTSRFEAEPLMRRLQSVGVAAGVVRGLAEALEDPHLGEWYKVMTHADLGAHKYSGFPWRFASCELAAKSPPPRLGEHSEALLAELLGLTPGDIEALKAKDVTGAVL